MSWGDGLDKYTTKPGDGTRTRVGSPPPQRTPQPGKGTPQPPGQKLNRWQGVAKEIQSALQSDSTLLPGTTWPCCQRFLTGKCDPTCRTCSKAGSPQRGDKPARDVAAKVLERLAKGDKLSPECAAAIKDGERERA